MSFVHIPYESIEELVSRFQLLNPMFDALIPGDPNFVLVDPDLYYGSYGGLVYDSVLSTWSSQMFSSSSIGHGMSIAWWNTSDPASCGDLYALSYEDLVAVTPDLFEKMVLNKVRRQPIESSYFGRASRINRASTS